MTADEIILGYPIGNEQYVPVEPEEVQAIRKANDQSTRLTMTVELEHAQLMQNWAPPSDELEWSDVSLRVDADATVEQWHAKLTSYADRLSIRDETTPTFRVSDLVYDASTSTTLVYLQQTLNGLDIVNASANLAVQSSGQVVSVFSSFVDTSKLTGSQLRAVELSPAERVSAIRKRHQCEFSALDGVWLRCICRLGED